MGYKGFKSKKEGEEGMNSLIKKKKMVWRPVTSANPKKSEIVNAICNYIGFKCKVTCVKESDTHICGHAQKYIKETRCYKSLGFVELKKEG